MRLREAVRLTRQLDQILFNSGVPDYKIDVISRPALKRDPKSILLTIYKSNQEESFSFYSERDILVWLGQHSELPLEFYKQQAQEPQS